MAYASCTSCQHSSHRATGARLHALAQSWSVWLLALSIGLFHTPAAAHESAPGVLSFKETPDGRYWARWTPSMPPVENLVVHLPEPCTIAGKGSFGHADAPVIPSEMDCQGQLAGEVRFTTDWARIGPIGVNVEWRDGSQSMQLSQGSPPHVVIGGMSHDLGAAPILRDYGVLGVEHILGGIDHLLFVLGLLLLSRSWRGLLATISSFTLAHSLTLAAASLELVKVSSGPVEISIALSVLLLAFEITQTGDTLTRRWPWLVAFGFGLLHGFGFASALSDVGLPRQALALSLLGFNLGVEVGQIGVVACLFGAYRLLAPTPPARRRVEWLAVGVLAACSTFWLLQRVEGWLLGFVT